MLQRTRTNEKPPGRRRRLRRILTVFPFRQPTLSIVSSSNAHSRVLQLWYMVQVYKGIRTQTRLNHPSNHSRNGKIAYTQFFYPISDRVHVPSWNGRETRRDNSLRCLNQISREIFPNFCLSYLENRIIKGTSKDSKYRNRRKFQIKFE